MGRGANQANALREMAPKSTLVERVYNWVVQTGQQRREQALENKIRDIDAKNSTFDPTVKSLLTEPRIRVCRRARIFGTR
jgi:hypothetical protein